MLPFIPVPLYIMCENGKILESKKYVLETTNMLKTQYQQKQEQPSLLFQPFFNIFIY